MKASRLCTCAFGALVFISVAGCSKGGYPISVEITMPIATGYSVSTYGLLDPGDLITPETDIPLIPICTLPTRDDVDEMVREAVGGVVAGMIDLDRLDLLEITIEATNGDFSTLTQFAMSYVPKPVLAVPQPPVDLGETVAAGGLGSVMTLQPPDTPDFLNFIEENDANPALGCPGLDVTLSGTVPAVTPTWDVRARLRVVGHVSI